MKTSTACLSPRNLKQSLRDGKGRRSKVAKKRITYKLDHLRKCTVLNEDFSISLAFRRGPFAKVNYNWVFHCNFNVNMTTSMQKFQKFLHRNHWGSWFLLKGKQPFCGSWEKKIQSSNALLIAQVYLLFKFHLEGENYYTVFYWRIIVHLNTSMKTFYTF